MRPLLTGAGELVKDVVIGRLKRRERKGGHNAADSGLSAAASECRLRLSAISVTCPHNARQGTARRRRMSEVRTAKVSETSRRGISLTEQDGNRLSPGHRSGELGFRNGSTACSVVEEP